MTILLKHTHLNKFTRQTARCGMASAAIVVMTLAVTAQAQTWVTFDLPALVSTDPHFGALAVSHLSDGQFVYGNNNSLYLQDSFGSPASTEFTTPPNVDPSFIAVLNDTTAVVGSGQFGSLPVYQFNPSNPASPDYTSIASLQNFGGAPAGTSGVYVVGTNDAGGSNSVSYVSLGGSQQLVVDPAGAYSAGVAVDKSGNLFVGDNDTNSVYEFTQAQVQNAIAHSTQLVFSNGLLVHTFASDVVGSLAVDAEGRIWAAGFGADGLYFWNPTTNQGGVMNPEAAGGQYTVSSFSTSGNNYVNFIWQAGFTSGNEVVYGYDTVQNVPEPASSVWLASLVASGAVVIGVRRRTKRKT